MEELFRQKQIDEAIKRLKLLEVCEDVISQFDDDGVVNVSYMYGMLFNANEEEQNIIQMVENEYDALVYHMVRTVYEGDIVMYSLFYVSASEDEWEFDREDLKEQTACVYVFNCADEWCSELGYINFAPLNGGLERIA